MGHKRTTRERLSPGDRRAAVSESSACRRGEIYGPTARVLGPLGPTPRASAPRRPARRRARTFAMNLPACRKVRHTIPEDLAFSPLARDGATRRHQPSQGHGSSPEDFHQIPGCMADRRDSIMPWQFSSLPYFDAEQPAVPAPQRAMLHPHQVHISTSRELLAYPLWQCVSRKMGNSQDSSHKPHGSS